MSICKSSEVTGKSEPFGRVMLIAVSTCLLRWLPQRLQGPLSSPLSDSTLRLFLYILCRLEFSNPLLLCSLKRRLLVDPLSTFECVLEILRCQNSPGGLVRLNGEGRANILT